MSNAILVLVTVGGALQYRRASPSGGQFVQGSAAEALTALPAADAVTVLLTSAHVSLTEVTVKVRSRGMLRNAVAYALEDQLADEVDELMFEIGTPGADDTYPVAVASRTLIESVVGDFAESGINTVRCVPYVFAVPLEHERDCVLNDGSLVVVRNGAYSGFTAPATSAPAIFERLERERGVSRPRSQFVLGDAKPTFTGPDERSADARSPASFAGWLDGNIAAGPILSFALAGPERTPVFERKLAAAAALLLAALVVHTGFVYSRTTDNEDRLASTQAETRSIFRATFPEVNRVVNPKVQAGRLLARLRDDRPRGLAFLDGMHTLGSAIADLDDDTRVKSIRYLGGRFDLTLELPELAALEQVRTAFAVHNIEAEIVSVENRDARVVGRLQFEQAAP